eukprot:102377-Amphidinium_carterae.1
MAFSDGAPATLCLCLERSFAHGSSAFHGQGIPPPTFPSQMPLVTELDSCSKLASWQADPPKMHCLMIGYVLVLCSNLFIHSATPPHESDNAWS